MTRPLELWGGVECTVNRIGDRYHDQLAWSGHAHRADDLARIAALGIRCLRYPILWERVAPRGVARADWTWADERLGMLRAAGIEPIVTLAHHGSGIRGATLLDDGYAEAFTEYAAAVAERYPWVASYTPVNEPLTTARFAALYGHWYPHARDDHSFTRALLAQIRATVLAMRAIRAVRPDARLVQTEDLGLTRGTPALGTQVAFENERRWLTWDLLWGRVGPGHAMWRYLSTARRSADALAWHVDNPMPPDVVGINTYVTSERFLDQRLRRYPARVRGGNGRVRYADVEAVRVCAEGLAGVGRLLREASARYRRPIAITEAHMGCTREEQIRWLRDVWVGACAARADGANVVAVTAWALFGTFNWQNLVTRDDGHYEPGAFDVRADPPRPTAVAHALRELADGRLPSHPAAEGRGWWARRTRFSYPVVRARSQTRAVRVAGRRDARPCLVVLARDPAVREVVRGVCARRGLRAVVVPVTGASVEDAATALAERLARHGAWAILDAPSRHRRGSRRGRAVDLAAERAGVPVLRLTRVRPPDGRPILHVAAGDPSVAPARLLDDALDLLIDGETGRWRIGPLGPSPVGAFAAVATHGL